MKVAVAVLVLAACVKSSSISCPDGRTCPQGTVCAQVTNPDESLCVQPEQIADCTGKQPLDPCEATGHCFDGVCLTAACGNNRLDPGEACDKGDAAAGNGCSADCLSDESCGNGILDPITSEQCDDANLIGRDGCTSSCKAEQLAWHLEPYAQTIPFQRWRGAMAYDASSGHIVMFGGNNYGDPTYATPAELSDTWEFAGRGWRLRVSPVHPGARYGAAMAYDAGRHRVVLFGGATIADTGATFGDTWEWFDEAWHPAPESSSHPPPRANAALAYDPVRRVVVLWGGNDNTGHLFADTWTFDGITWKQVATAHQPPAGGYAGMVFDPVRGVMIMTSPNLHSETWSYDGGDWTMVTPTGPHARSGLAYDLVGHRILAFGGNSKDGASGGVSVAAVMAFDGASWTTLPVTIPTSIDTTNTLEQLQIATDVAHQRIVIFSGASFGSPNTVAPETLEFTSTFTTVSPTNTILPTHTNFVGAMDRSRGILVEYGGLSSGITPGPDATTYELDDQGWRTKNSPPPARYNQSMTYDDDLQAVVMFGGQSDATSRMGDTWAYENRAWKQLTAGPPPSARFGAGLTYDRDRRRLVLFGGNDSTGLLADTWEWDGSTWAPITTTNPPAKRSFPAIAYDVLHHRTVMFGGTGTTDPATWLWDGMTWTQATPTISPPTRGGGTLVWDAARERLVLWGGAPFDSTIWEWDGTDWQPQVAAGGPTVQPTTAVLTPDRRGSGLLLNTISSTGTNETWRLAYESDVDYEGCYGTLDADGDGHAGCADPDCWVVCTPQCPPGTTCDPATPHCGDGTCSGMETSYICPDDCPLTVTCGDGLCSTGETSATCPGDCH